MCILAQFFVCLFVCLFLNADSLGLGQGLKFCFSSKLLGDADNGSPVSTLEEASVPGAW